MNHCLGTKGGGSEGRRAVGGGKGGVRENIGLECDSYDGWEVRGGGGEACRSIREFFLLLTHVCMHSFLR